MKNIITKACIALILMILLPMQSVYAEKNTTVPEYLRVSVESAERKEDNNRRFVYKEYLHTSNEAINAELRAIADGFDETLFPTLQEDSAKNARRNSRLDIEGVYTFTGDRWLSVMTLARVSYQRNQVCSPFTTRTYDVLSGERITLDDLFPENSPAWSLLADRVREHVGGLFPSEPRDAEAVEALVTEERLHNAEFTLSGMELTLHYEAKEVYPTKACLMHVRFYYDELWDMMTDVAREQTDNSQWKMVAITCDDGPGYSEVAKALTAFRNAGARVTYFTVGKKLEGYSDILMREFDQNHTIASHSFNHWSGFAMEPEKRLKELAMHNELLLELVGEEAPLFRAPGGTYRPWIEAGIGLPIIQWSLDTYDYTGKDAKHIFYSIRNNVQDGDVILMHDSGAELWKAVPLFTEYLTENGYMMVTVEELAHANGVIMEPNVVYYRFIDGETGKRTDGNT